MENKIIICDLEYFIEAVEDNNFINDAEWRDWYGADHIIDTYTESFEDVEYQIDEDIEYIKEKLDELIKNNGL